MREALTANRQPWLRTRVQDCKEYLIVAVLNWHIDSLSTEVEFTL